MFSKILIKNLLEKGWKIEEHTDNSVYDILSFGEYTLVQDNSSWMMLYRGDEFISDLISPDSYTAGWIANLVMKLIDYNERLNEMTQK